MSFKALPVKTVKKPMCPNVPPVRVNHKYKQNENFRKDLLKKVLVNTCFDKVADPQTTTLSKTWTPLQYISSNLFTSMEPLIQSTPSKLKVTILKCNLYYVTQGISLFIFSHWSLYVWLINAQNFTNTKKNRLINSVSFRVRSILHVVFSAINPRGSHLTFVGEES